MDSTTYCAILNFNVVFSATSATQRLWNLQTVHTQISWLQQLMETHRAHCLLLPYPVQGHLNPMLQFAKRLQHEGVKITFAITKFLFETVDEVSASISVETISDGYDEGANGIAMEIYFPRFQKVGSETLTELVLKLQDSGRPVDCIIYDAFLPWCLDVAKDLGVRAGVFFTQSCAVNNIYNHVHKGLLKLPLEESGVDIPGLPPLLASDLPSFVSNPGLYPASAQMFVHDQIENFEEADWIFFNTFYGLEEEVIHWMAKILPVKTIGPTIPSMYLEKRLEDDKQYCLNLFKPMTNACMSWLNERSISSVVYVSFGSLAELEVKQMEELAWGLRASSYYFLWVVRESESKKLPKDFVKETFGKGLIISWCPQLDVLAHKSIGCFITHCGWNSTLEALSLGVPMIAMPQWTDQSTNAKFVMDVWKMGIKAGPDEAGIVRRDAISQCIKLVMDGKKGQEISKHAKKWKDLARQAFDEGGSSDKNIKDFVSKLIQSWRD
ncbi:UDP-glycosyltransferase 74G1-like [Coffea eugenioides]|uniref:UDP-glycosyltransferase 74G1-like n=1 Tax=Coffea eugenioides TaxID=49369 RepID=UPI000F6156A7|nr:UDP-glycosyltransferase 74G1-like [Coffea eugenioides]